ncbi:hypothetical protein IQ272_27285 [Chroococcidiopsidales cyanobacterium LEGE 13417]|uniref:hypothetical protein n=1 Tax=Chroococcidiopsis sp. CCALA 051 TaxID=869949 RepID=UPI0011B1DB77|nr:hypothetical protein [Chroococcidiopsis sp. CCALA 051]MBE9019769.1 hypothetical protein [Chroococcidiopsidales cyanobacterium LEGE 13417]
MATTTIPPTERAAIAHFEDKNCRSNFLQATVCVALGAICKAGEACLSNSFASRSPLEVLLTKLNN